MGPRSPETAGFDALVSGSVQGVGFRYTAIREAQALGLVGFVRNTAEGEVEVHAEGPAGELALFAEWLHEGPPGARVKAVALNPCKPTGYYDSFGVDY
jgi:acylphosphatase